MALIPIVGYADRFSLAPGENIAFKVSSDSPAPYSARLVRVISGDPSPMGPGLIEEDIVADFTGNYPSRSQSVHLGSHMTVAGCDAIAGLESFTFAATIAPTTPDKGQQAVMARYDSKNGAGFALVIGPNGAGMLVGDGTSPETAREVGKPLATGRWYHVWASFDAATDRNARHSSSSQPTAAAARRFSAQWSTAARSAPALGSIRNPASTASSSAAPSGSSLTQQCGPSSRTAAAEVGDAEPLTGVTAPPEAERPRGVHRAAAAAAPAI